MIDPSWNEIIKHIVIEGIENFTLEKVKVGKETFLWVRCRYLEKVIYSAPFYKICKNEEIHMDIESQRTMTMQCIYKMFDHTIFHTTKQGIILHVTRKGENGAADDT